jgi:hypothetical protein
MIDVDGFTLIDYIKSSIEILMNMKMEENQHKEYSAAPKKLKGKVITPIRKE